MSDTEDQPVTDEPSTDASTESAAPPDPVKGAKDDAWLAQFRADNAAKVMQHNYAASEEALAEAKAAEAQRDFDLKMGDQAAFAGHLSHEEAADLEKKAQADAARHDEYELQAQKRSHKADEADALAETFRHDAERADGVARQDHKESDELYALHVQNTKEYDILQSEAVAAQRIATDEERLHQMTDAPPEEAGPEIP
jgi:hypothetical protein